MKSLFTILSITLLMISCSTSKKDSKSLKDYKPEVSFAEGEKTFSSKVGLPKEFKDRLPLVILVHEWWGRTPYIEERARMLEAEGYATLAVDLFGNGLTVDNPTAAQAQATPFYQNPEIGIKRLQKYVDLAKKDPHVNPDQIVVIGYCFGGTQALNLARSGSGIAGAVSFHGGLASTYSAKEIKAKVLVLNGAADPMVPPKEVAGFREEMKTIGADFKVINYPNATHAFSNPKATEIGKKFNIPVAYNKAADKASWNELLKFLKSVKAAE